MIKARSALQNENCLPKFLANMAMQFESFYGAMWAQKQIANQTHNDLINSNCLQKKQTSLVTICPKNKQIYPKNATTRTQKMHLSIWNQIITGSKNAQTIWSTIATRSKNAHLAIWNQTTTRFRGTQAIWTTTATRSKNAHFATWGQIFSIEIWAEKLHDKEWAQWFQNSIFAQIVKKICTDLAFSKITLKFGRPNLKFAHSNQNSQIFYTISQLILCKKSGYFAENCKKMVCIYAK